MRQRLRVLLTNDDGIHALGLCALYEALADEHELYVVAPDSERSAVGHAITLTDPLKVRKVKRRGIFFGWAISGTPADCVKLAVNELIKDPIDLVLSGINQGANVGINVLYSGTVSAATEAAILGIRSAAISLDEYIDPDFCFAAHFAREIIPWVMGIDIYPYVALNINIPSVSPDKISGVKLAKQGTARFVERFEKRIDPRGNIYYWQAGETMDCNDERNVDYIYLKRGFITITPIHHDLTNYELLKDLNVPWPVQETDWWDATPLE